MRNVPICAVMAFSLAAAAADETEEFQTLNYGETKACEPVEFGAGLAPTNNTEKLLATYAESGLDTVWVRVLQQGNKYVVETAMTDGIRQTDRARPRRRNIDPELAAQVSARLAEDLSQNAFVETSNEIPIDGIWYLYTADGKICATVPWISLNTRADAWARVFSALYGNARDREAIAWFLLEQLAQRAATLPTSLAGMTREQYVIGAASTWNHPGAEPLTILNHRASIYDDKVVIVGELENNMGTARDHVKVLASYFDTNGAVLATDSTYVDFSLLPAGDRSPFDLITSITNAASYTLRIDPGEASRLRPPTVRITYQQARRDEEDLIVRGTVRNDGKRTEESIEVHLILYDQDGRILDSDYEHIDQPLKTGASAAFEASIECPPGYHHYEVIVNPEYRESRE